MHIDRFLTFASVDLFFFLLMKKKIFLSLTFSPSPFQFGIFFNSTSVVADWLSSLCSDRTLALPFLCSLF
jgi:hypothetical protein